MAVRTAYLAYPELGRLGASTQDGPIPRGSGGDGGPPNLIGTIIVMTGPPGPVVAGTPVRLTAVQTGGGAPLTYQWLDPGGQPIPGATGPTYVFTPTLTQGGTYTVTVTPTGRVTDGPTKQGGAVVAVVAAPYLIDETANRFATDTGALVTYR